MAENKENDGTLGKTVLGYIDRGVEASKRGLKSASSAISEFGDKSVRRIELSQLKSRLTKTYAKLGSHAYEKFVAEKMESLSPSSDEDLASMIDEIKKIQKDIQKHEKALKNPEKGLAEDKKKTSVKEK
ncbi:MAG: hypothetical protein J6Y60_04950 [Treponema sp.]|nr:hypothetical protein [Treponema sp.]